MMKRSNVYFGFRSSSLESRKRRSRSACRGDDATGLDAAAVAVGAGGRLTGTRGASATTNDDGELPTERVARAAAATSVEKWLSTQSRVKSFGQRHSEPGVVERLRLGVGEPGLEDRVAERPAKAAGDRGPGAVERSVPSCAPRSSGSCGGRESGEHTTVAGRRSTGLFHAPVEENTAVLQGFYLFHTSFHRCGRRRDRLLAGQPRTPREQRFPELPRQSPNCGKPRSRTVVYTRRSDSSDTRSAADSRP